MRLPVLTAALGLVLAAQEFPLRTFIAGIDSNSVTVAWGRADGTTRNSIGKSAEGSGEAVIRIDGRTLTSRASWLRIDGLKPDSEYQYSVTVDGAAAGGASVRTWPEKSESLTYFVIGDFGNGDRDQYALAARMEEERQRLEKSNRHVRFVITTGDNIYGKLSASGSEDRDWEKKYFAPYATTLRSIPFKAVLGNHDGNESEKTADLATCLDNFFMPDRWYRFEYASFVEFIALDSTKNQPQGRASPLYLAGGPQSRWLAETLAKPPLPWRVAVMHHPMFTAGPNHAPFLENARHWFLAMRSAGVQVVFAGHEHNLQFSERNAETGGMQFVVSGAGGELRDNSVRKKMAERHIAAWANQIHFLIVEITGKQMTIEPVGIAPLRLVDSNGKPVAKPIAVPSNR